MVNRVCVDAITRRRIIESRGSEDVVDLPLGATGLGNLACYVIERCTA